MNGLKYCSMTFGIQYFILKSWLPVVNMVSVVLTTVRSKLFFFSLTYQSSLLVSPSHQSRPAQFPLFVSYCRYNNLYTHFFFLFSAGMKWTERISELVSYLVIYLFVQEVFVIFCTRLILLLMHKPHSRPFKPPLFISFLVNYFCHITVFHIFGNFQGKLYVTIYATGFICFAVL